MVECTSLGGVIWGTPAQSVHKFLHLAEIQKGSDIKIFIDKRLSTILVTALLSTLISSVAIAPARATSPANVNLGSANSFAVLSTSYVVTSAPATFGGNIGAGSAVTTGANNTVNGSIYSGAAVTTGASTSVSGSMYAIGAITNGAGFTIAGSQYLSPAPEYTAATDIYTAAITSLNAAKSDISGRAATGFSGVLASATFGPGVYNSTAAIGLAGAATVTLDGGGNTNAVFIFKTDAAIVTGAASQVVLINGARARNVFWSPGGALVTGADSIFVGNILATSYVSLGANTGIEGRIFSQNSYITMGVGGANSTFGFTGIGTNTVSTTGTTPSVLGSSQSAATTALSGAGFSVGTVTTTTVGATALNNGQVFSQSATGANQPFATPIDLVLYAYVAPPTTGSVLSVLGLNENIAKIVHDATGFTTGTVTTTTVGATALNNGQVFSQSATGANQPFATPIDLVLYAYVAPPTTGAAPSVPGSTQVPGQTPGQTSMPNKTLTVYFKSNRSTLSKKEKAAIRAIGTSIKKQTTANAKVFITITGSVDPTRKRPFNKKLAMARAKKVISELKKTAPKAKYKIVIVKGALTSAKNRNAKIEWR